VSAVRDDADHQALRAVIRGVVQQEAASHLWEWEETGCPTPRTLFQALGREGLLGLRYPARYGGGDMGYRAHVILGEELGSLPGLGVGLAISTQTDTCTPCLAAHGSDELCAEFLSPAISGEMIGAIAVTEPGAGTDLGAIATAARIEDDRIVISGRKCYVTNGGIADFVVTVCRTAGTSGVAGLSLVVVPRRSPGLTGSRPYRKLGARCCDHAELTYDDVSVPVRNLIGPLHAGYEVLTEQFQYERTMLASIGWAQAKRLLSLLRPYVTSRSSFGRRLIEHQRVSFALAEMQLDLESLRFLVDDCARRLTSGADCVRESAMAKLRASRLLCRAADEFLHLSGAHGYMESREASLALRDSRALSLAGGTDEAMLQIIGGLADAEKR
jgi:citronellyl-CoA dehydrogenase